MRPTRRAFLASLGVSLGGALAGCGSERPPPGTESPTTSATASESDTPAASRTTRTAVLRNDTDRERYVTLAVFDGDSPVFSESQALSPGAAGAFPLAVTAGRRYRVVVETTDGVREEYPWTVLDSFDSVVVRLGPETTFRRVARCTPDCGEFSRGGEATDLPRRSGIFTGWYSPATLMLENPGDRRRRVRVSVRGEAGRLLDYRYELPATSRLVVPVTQDGGRYEVSVEAGGRTRQRTWHVPEELELHVRVGADVDVSCGEPDGRVLLRNRESTRRRFELDVRRDGADAFFGVFGVDAESVRTVETNLRWSGEYALRVAVDGETTTFEWWACPPRGPVVVTFEGGRVSVDQVIDR